MNPLFELYVFDVWLWQSIFFRPIWYEYTNLMVDVWHNSDWNRHPIDFIISQWLLPILNWQYFLGNLTITNYDHDHYSWLPYLREKVYIHTTNLIQSISPQLLYNNKPDKTEALNHLVNVKNTYTWPAINRNPPYIKFTKYLYPQWNWEGEFNNLSQIVFIEYGWFTICVPGDLEQEWWKLMLQYEEVINKLRKTQIFFASHHWRENGYIQEIFNYCNPRIVIISDKEIIHSTQENSSDRYAKHVIGEWLTFHWQQNRKVISTRNDWSFCFHGLENLHYSINKIDF